MKLDPVLLRTHQAATSINRKHNLTIFHLTSLIPTAGLIEVAKLLYSFSGTDIFFVNLSLDGVPQGVRVTSISKL